jgi:hypothetical protein
MTDWCGRVRAAMDGDLVTLALLNTGIRFAFPAVAPLKGAPKVSSMCAVSCAP